MAKARIYDAQFGPLTPKSHLHHLIKFWWVDETGKKGTWTREEAYTYVHNHPGDIFVHEGGFTVSVTSHSNSNTVWIQTRPDSSKRDNLITLAIRHDHNLPNY